MSASLVGSEMCIRDRSSGAVREAPREFQWAFWRFPASPGEQRRAPGSSGCLLYTSDAADDM
eukprot:6148721-Alexandrium_andersonii.AAC.1